MSLPISKPWIVVVAELRQVARIVQPIEEEVVAGAAVQDVDPQAALDHVVAVAAGQGVDVEEPEQRIVAGAAEDLVLRPTRSMTLSRHCR